LKIKRNFSEYELNAVDLQKSKRADPNSRPFGSIYKVNDLSKGTLIKKETIENGSVSLIWIFFVYFLSLGNRFLFKVFLFFDIFQGQAVDNT
jgi:hypothetical protein